MKKYFIGLCLILAFLAARSNLLLGFSLSKILCDPPRSEQTPTELPTLSEPYQYLSHGRQTFVFESADGKTVIKFFNQNYIKLSWYHLLPLPGNWREKQKKKIELRQRFYKESYPLAMETFQEESGLIYLHLKNTDQTLPSLTVIDPFGREQLVDLNQTTFVIQKKGIAYLTHIEEVSKKEGLAGLKREIDAWIDFCSKRIAMKISDYDHDIWQNVGFLDGKILFIDPGKFYRNEELADLTCQSHEWWKATHRLHKWLAQENEEAAKYLESVLPSAL